MDEKQANNFEATGEISESLPQSYTVTCAEESVPPHEDQLEPSMPVLKMNDFIPDNFDWVRYTKIVLTLVSLAVMLILAGTLIGIYAWDYGLIADGITINNIDVGHLSLAAAKEKIFQQNQSLLEHKVEFDADGQKTELTLAELGLTYPVDKVLDQAYTIGRQGSLPQKVLAKLRAALGLKLSVSPVWEDDKLRKALQKLSYLNQVPVDASFSIENETMTIHKETAGRAVDITSLMQEVKKTLLVPSLSEGRSRSCTYATTDLRFLNGIKEAEPGDPHPIIVPIQEIKPQITSDQLENLKPTGVLATYTTHFDPSLVNRTQNIRIAAKTLNGLLLKPGENFSFNERVGPRTEKSGYLDAVIIENGEFVPGLGGGVCQVSTTLYNTLLLADLPVTERANHALAIAYAPLGQDATVAYRSLDLKFRNDSGGYLLIRSQVSGDALTFTLYGKVVPGKEVIISNQVLQTILPHEQMVMDSSLPAGTTQVRQSGQSGYIVKSTRTVKINGEITKIEDLGSSTYQSIPRIIATG